MKKADYIHMVNNIEFLLKWIEESGRDEPRRRPEIMMHKLLKRTLPLLRIAVKYVPKKEKM